MSEKHSNIDQQLQSKFNEFAPLPPLSWEQMEVALEKNVQKKNRKRALGWLAAASLAIATASGAYFFGLNSESKIDSISISKNSVSPKTEKTSNNSSELVSKTNPTQTFNQDLEMDASTETGASFSSKSINTKSKNNKFSNSKYEVELLHDYSQEVPLSIEQVVYSDGPFSKYLSVSLSHFDLSQLDLPKLQPQKTMRKQLSKWSFEVGYDQNQTAMMYKTNADLSQYVHKNYLQHMKESEFALSASQVHAALRYQLSHNWILSAGWSWMQNRTQQIFRFQDSMPASVSQGNKSDAYGNYPIFGYMGLGKEVNYSGISNLSMLSLPISLIYEQEIKRGWKFTAEGLIQSNYISAKKGQTLNYHYLTLQDIGGNTYRNWVFSAKIGAGIQREINPRASIGARINTQGMLNSLYKSNSAIENRGWSVGLSAVYIWRLF